MNGIITAVAVLGAVGAVAALLLVIASKYMSVKEDERFPKIRACLPGANCGACGYLCVPGADAASRKLSEVLGVPFADVIEQVAFVHCSGDCETAQDKCSYEGIHTCAAAKMLYGGEGRCVYKCAGLGDCVRACPQGAIHLEKGVAKVNTKMCTGCGICAKTCPNHLIRLFADVERVVVTCSNHDRGVIARNACTNGCIACRKCEKNCPHEAVKVVNNLAVIDYDKCVDCETCAKNCPVGCIKISDFSGVHRFIKEEA